MKISDTRDCQYFEQPVGQVCDLLPGPPQPTSAVSRKSHGAAGAFDIDLPRTGNPGIECRTAGSAGVHQLIVAFATPVTCQSADLTTGVGSVSSFGVSGDGRQVTVDLTRVGNAQRIIVTLNVTDAISTGNVAIPMAVLLGDTSADGVVNSGDVTETRRRSGQVTTQANFRTDLSVDGVINSADVTLVRRASGSALP